MAAPAAARKRAVGTPSRLATLPQTALPRVIAPKNAVRKIARPRPRTHSGNATCAETNSVVIIVIHDAPAIRLASAAMIGSRAAPYNPRARIVPSVPSVANRSGPRRALRLLSANDPRIEPSADHAEQDAVDFGAIAHLRARDQRQKRPIRAGEGEKGDGADERRVDDRDCFWRSADRCAARCTRRSAGRVSLVRRGARHHMQRGKDGDIAGAKTPEWQGDAEGRDRQAGKRRADRRDSRCSSRC